jgi:D-alanyl-D-alanine carboxypeptidase
MKPEMRKLTVGFLMMLMMLMPAAGSAAKPKSRRAGIPDAAQTTASCVTLCFRSPQYYLNWLDRLPRGVIRISGGGTNSSVSTANKTGMKLALDGGDSVQDRFNRQFAAAQLNLLSAPGGNVSALRSPLGCFNLSFDAVTLSPGGRLAADSSLRDLFGQANLAANSGNAADLEILAGILGLLNGDGPLGDCSKGGKLAFSSAMQAALDQALNSTLAQHRIPGAIVGIWIPGAGSWEAARGVADVVSGKPMQPDNHFRIGSNTKTFTVTALMQLADGPNPKLRLDDPVGKYLSFVPNGDRITLRMLANMTSGLASYTQSEEFYKALLGNTQRVWMPRELVDIGLALPVHFAPGQGWYYSNTNTVLLGMVIEQVTGKPIREVFAERIFNPLGLLHTVWPLDSSLPEPYARGITEQTLDGKQADATNWNPSWGNAAGQLISNLNDMRIWARALGTGQLLSPRMQAERLKFVTIPPQTPTESYGLGIGYDNGWLGHTGALMGYTSSVYYLPVKDAIIVVLTNSDIPAGGDAPSVAIFKALARIVTPGNVPKRG